MQLLHTTKLSIKYFSQLNRSSKHCIYHKHHHNIIIKQTLHYGEIEK